MRATEDVRLLRTAPVFACLMESIGNASSAEFRIVHFSVQRDHVHLIVEAHDKTSLSRGMRGLAIRLARAINRALLRRGVCGKSDITRARSPARVRFEIVSCICS